MSKIIEEAMEKIQSEMHKESNPYVQVVGNFLIGALGNNEAAAEKVMVEGKTILGSLKSMEAEAKKKKVGNCAVLTDEEGFQIVLKYFEITSGAKKENSNKVISLNEYKKESKELDIDLDNLLDDL